MSSALRGFGQIALYAAFGAVVVAFSAFPPYTRIDSDSAVIKLSFSHAGALREPCRTLSAEELAALAANMRSGVDCPRERVPVVVELEIDGERVYHAVLSPSGIAGDGHRVLYPLLCSRAEIYEDRGQQKQRIACASAASTMRARPTSGSPRVRASSSTSARSSAVSGSCRATALPRSTSVSRFPRAPTGFESACETPCARVASTMRARPTSGSPRVRASSSTSARSSAVSGSCRAIRSHHPRNQRVIGPGGDACAALVVGIGARE